jgi:hypothetical protein
MLTLERIYVAFGLPRPAPDEHVREEDLRLIKSIPVLFGAGVSEGEVLRMARIWGDSARRVAQFQSHYFHHSIEEPFRRRGCATTQPSRRRSKTWAFGLVVLGRTSSAGSTGVTRKSSRPSIYSITWRPRSSNRSPSEGTTARRRPRVRGPVRLHKTDRGVRG